MRVAKVMSEDPITVPAAAQLGRAVQLMDEAGVRHLPVLEDGELAGVLSDRELLEATGWRLDGDGARGLVRRHMRIPVETVDPEATLPEAARQMFLWGVGCLPVVGDGGLVGMLSEMDVLAAFVGAAHEDGLHDPPIAELMTREVVTVTRETSVEEARGLMLHERVRHLPILDGRTVTAIVSDRDLRYAIGRGLSASTPVSALVAGDLVTAGPSERLSRAAELMELHRIGAVVVLDEGRLTGIVTSLDVLEHAAGLDWGEKGS
jgi:acetoin utilization protein AcuB